MKIELIPVIEIGYHNQGVKAPKKYPYWENQEIWWQFQRESYKKVGFKDEFIPYLKGSPFYEPKNISEENLTKLVLDNTEVFRENGMKEREFTNPFFGGYVLRINYEDKYFPQCCGDLGDIKYWETLLKKQDGPNEGHPKPTCYFRDNVITLDFTVGKHSEYFMPTPPDIKLLINMYDLKSAIENAKIELKQFAKRLIEINKNLNLGIERIEDLLIWKNPNYD